MYTPYTHELPPLGARFTAALGSVTRTALAILCIAAVVATIAAVRTLVFEVNHGDPHIVERLLNGGKS